MSEVSDDPRRTKRLLFRVAGLVVLFVAVLMMLLGVADLFGAMTSDDINAEPTRFWMLFVGVPLLAVGGWLLQAGFARALTSYFAEETAPAVRTTAEALGIRSDADPSAPGGFCRRCGKAARSDAQFCDGCGAALA
jgi:hypothetical protein